MTLDEFELAMRGEITDAEDFSDEQIRETAVRYHQQLRDFREITQAEFDYQVEHYGEESYHGQAGPGDTLWYDGEVFCDHDTVSGYLLQVTNDMGRCCNDETAARLVLYTTVVERLSELEGSVEILGDILDPVGVDDREALK